MALTTIEPSVKGYYEEYWTKLGDYRRALGPRTLRELEGQVRLTSDVLEVGCGTGQVVGRWSEERCGKYFGVDISANSVNYARKLGLDVCLIQDASRLPFDDLSFDVVVCLEVLEHLFQPQLAAQEILRVLRPGGVLIATVPNLTHWRHRMHFFVTGTWNPSGDDLSVREPWRDPHIRFFTRKIFLRMLSLMGFCRVRIFGEEPERLRRIPLIGRFLANPTHAWMLPTSWSHNLVAVAFKPGPTDAR